MARLLVIEDQAAVREMVCIVLRSAGHTIVEASNGDDGLKTLEHEKVDLVLTDLVMPGTEGIATIREIRNLYPRMKIVAMSGTGAYSLYLDAAAKLGADMVLEKPFRPDELREAIARTLAQPEKAA